MNRLLAVSLAASFVGLVSTARADVLPSTPETCVLEKVQMAGETCESCGTSYEAPAACSAKYAGTPLTQRCRTAGASVWTEIWCSPAAGKTAAAEPAPPAAKVDGTPAGAPTAAAPATKSGCASASFGVVGVAGLAALLRRRRR